MRRPPVGKLGNTSDGDAPQKYNRKLLKAGMLRDEELHLRRKDGSTFIGAVSAVAMKDEDGRVKYYDGIIEVVSLRKAAELALKESEEKYRQLVENAQDAIFVTQPGYCTGHFGYGDAQHEWW